MVKTTLPEVRDAIIRCDACPRLRRYCERLGREPGLRGDPGGDVRGRERPALEHERALDALLGGEREAFLRLLQRIAEGFKPGA